MSRDKKKAAEEKAAEEKAAEEKAAEERGYPRLWVVDDRRKSITSNRGVLGPCDEVFAKDFFEGVKTLKDLYERGFLTEQDPNKKG